MFGPEKDTSSAQMEWCKELEGRGEWSDAASEYDALVREWPFSAEAPLAQKRLADIKLEHLGETEEAITEYRYLLDFYPADCNYAEVAEILYKACELWRDEGKMFVFFRFDNTVDVRVAYEALVLRAPGAKFAPDALLTIASLREDEGRLEEAVEVYGNLRNLHPASKAASTALTREAAARMAILRSKGYNRSRVVDTLDFLTRATAEPGENAAQLRSYRDELRRHLEEEDWKAACFYDSPTRTRRSAISALERFVAEHPASQYAAQARARIAEIEKGAK